MFNFIPFLAVCSGTFQTQMADTSASQIAQTVYADNFVSNNVLDISFQLLTVVLLFLGM